MGKIEAKIYAIWCDENGQYCPDLSEEDAWWSIYSSIEDAYDEHGADAEIFEFTGVNLGRFTKKCRMVKRKK